ncbi:MAG: neutral zinc metallopeptidase, partial [Pseudomonadota bacterium]
MKLDPRMRSRNVHDRRGLRGGRAAAGGGGLLVAGLIVASFIFPDELRPVLQILGVDGPGGAASQQQAAPIDDEINAFVSITLGYTEDFWSDAFASGAVTGESAPYQPATVVLFTGSARSQCGAASAQTGPFYCPADQSIYIDPDFYDVMATQLRSPGDFAQAYVIAHEVAHHVQNLAGVLRQVHQAKVRSNDPVMGNRLTVRLELQADCFAGVWARRTDEKHQILEQGDLGEA